MILARGSVQGQSLHTYQVSLLHEKSIQRRGIIKLLLEHN
jgi:hypothetical protein